MKQFCLLAFIFTSMALGADVPALMNKLVGLRSELEVANRELESDLRQKQAELDLWTQKKLELEGQVQKEFLRKAQLDEKVVRLESRLRREGKKDPKGLATFNHWLEQTRTWVSTGLPFRQEQRLATLTALQERASRGLESLEGLTSELWLFLESEVKMASDNEFRVADVNGRKGEIARLGLFAMYAKTTDDQIQKAVFHDGKWGMDLVSGAERDQVVRLLNNMRSKKDSGLYELQFKAERE